MREEEVPAVVSDDDEVKLNKLFAEVAENYATIYFNGELTKGYGWATMPTLLAYERPMFESMLRTMDEIDAIDPTRIDILDAKRLEVDGSSPQELCDKLKKLTT